MESIIKYAFESGTLNNIILSVAVIWAMWFITHYWWPNKVEADKIKRENDRVLREKEIEAETEIRRLEVQGQLEIYQRTNKSMDEIALNISGLRATYNDFLQNILSQFMEDRRDLIDTGVFKKKERSD